MQITQNNDTMAGAGTTHEAAEAATQLAARGERLFATIIDCIITIPLVFILASLWFGGFEAAMTGLDSKDPVNAVLGMLIAMLVFFAVNGFLIYKNGQTVGKKVMGIKIVRSNGDRASFANIVFRRNFAMMVITSIPFIGNAIGLIDVLLIFRQSRKCLHDEIADTIVISAK